MKNTNLLATIVAGLTLLCLGLPAHAQHPCQEDVLQNSLWSLPSLYAQFPDNDEDPPELNSLPIHNVPPEDSLIADQFYEGQLPTNAHNAIHDQNGELKYFIVDEFVYNREGYSIGFLSGSVFDDPNTGQVKGNSEVCIVPDPADCERYYIFSATRESVGGNTAYYTLLDASAYNTSVSNVVNADVYGEFLLGTGGYNDNCESVVAHLPFLTSSGGDVGEQGHLDYHYAASPLNEFDNSRLVLMLRGSTLFRMKLDDTGINPINPTGSVTIPGGPSARSEFELRLIESTSGNYYRAAIGYKGGVTVFELDLNGDLIPNSEHIIDLSEPWGSDYAYAKGLEFSASGEYLYFTNHITMPSNPDAVQYLDFSDMSTYTLDVSPLNQSDLQYSQIELGADGKLYFAYADGLAALEDADDPNSNWDPLAIPIPNYTLSEAEQSVDDRLNVYLLPDQIDGMNYYDHFLVEEDVECCLHHPPYDAFNSTPATSATWSPDSNPFHSDPECDVVLISNELRVPDGVHITIEDMRFEFSENARVVIEPGGKLTMDNTIFTYGPCGDRMWLGVEVWGTPIAGQSSFNYQGYLQMKNNSLIEHAWVGAVAGSRNGVVSSPPVFSMATGGVIHATDSRFRNNQRDVVIQAYIAEGPTGDVVGNRSRFTRCDFLIDDKLNLPEVMPLARADVRAVRNIKFRDCSFRNLASFQDFEMEDRGKGILSVDATFRVTGANEPFTGNEEEDFQTFYQFETAVDVNGSEEHHFTVSNMELQDNFMGIYVKGACFETITFNNFHIPELYNARGAELINSYLFTVEENNFFSGSQLTKNAGLVIDNSSKAEGDEEDAEYEGEQVENEVYRNTFEDLWGGIVVRNDNRGEIDQHGLQARCNQFANNQISDIFLSAYSEWRVNQGVLNPPDGRTNNVFSWPNPVCADSYRDLRVSDDYGAGSTSGTLYFNYHSFENANTRPVMDAYYTENNVLECNQPEMYVIENDNDFDFETHCPTSFDSGGGGKYSIAHLLQKRGEAKNNLESAEAVYQATVDGGSTQDILTLLQNTYNDESAYLRDLLMENYPLSRRALMAAIDAAESFDPWHLTQVLVANSRLPGDVYQFLKDNEVLTPFFMQFVEDAQTNSEASLTRLLQNEISLRSYEKSRTERDIHRHFLAHPDSIDGNAWQNYISGKDETYYRLHKIGDHLSKNETSEAQSLLDSLNIHPDRTDWINFKIDLVAADTVTANDIQEGWDFFLNKPSTRGDAWGWLTGIGELDSIQPLPEVVEHRNFSVNETNSPTKPERWLEAWPNPAKDRVVLTYPREADGIGTVQVFGPKGEFIREFAASDIGFQEINVTDWSPGLYIAKLIVNDKTFDTVKISVVR